jgi:hypothetical protein
LRASSCAISASSAIAQCVKLEGCRFAETVGHCRATFPDGGLFISGQNQGMASPHIHSAFSTKKSQHFEDQTFDQEVALILCIIQRLFWSFHVSAMSNVL